MQRTACPFFDGQCRLPAGFIGPANVGKQDSAMAATLAPRTLVAR
jgi:hypothetical protein